MKARARRTARAVRRTGRRLRSDPKLLFLERERRNQCWCGGELATFPLHRRYAICRICGTYVNIRPPTEAALLSLYSFDRYWHRKQRADLLPPIEERVALDGGDGRVDHWLELVLRHRPEPGGVVEIGCSHALLLERLSAAGYRCIGVEADAETAAWSARRTGVAIRAGLFPDVELPPCDVFLAFDVLEHVADPLAFMSRASELLQPGGVAIIQAPIERESLDPPFGSRFDDAFDGTEHLFVFTDRGIDELARRTGLDVIDNTDRLWLLGEIVVLQRRA